MPDAQNTTEKYRPSCGSEGMDFMARFCDRCKRDDAFQRGEGDSCPIVANSMAYDEDDPNYPVEWIEDATGPRCTAFEPIGETDVVHDNRQMDLL